MRIDPEIRQLVQAARIDIFVGPDLANWNRKEMTAGPRPRRFPVTAPETCVTFADLISILPTQGESPQGPARATGTIA